MNHLRTKKTHRKPDSTLPLINVVLLLILAFMISGTIAAPLPSGFDPLQASDSEKRLSGPAPVTVLILESGEAMRDGKRLGTADLDALFVEAADNGAPVEIRSDARAPARRLIALLGTAEDAGINVIEIVTLARAR